MILKERAKYITEIESWLGKGLAIVLTGQRRVGKSMCLKMLAERVGRTKECKVVYIDKEDHRFDAIDSSENLNKYLDSKYSDSSHVYILIDEVQEIAGFEHSIRSWIKRENVDVVVTGSNAKMLSGDLSTHLAARYHEVHIHSLSYLEFLEFHGLENSDSSLEKYMLWGGLPFLSVIGLENIQQITDYLNSVYDTVVLKDIIQRESVRNVPFLLNLGKFLSDNIGKNLSPNSIMKYMRSQGESIAAQSILTYLTFYCNAFLAYRVYRYDIHGKSLLENNEKYYFEDLGIRNALVRSSKTNDIEKRIENLVYLHLLRCGWKVRIGQLKSAEIDFVAEKGDQIIYIQATYIIASEDTEEREFGNLMAIRDNHQKIVVSMSPLNTDSSNQGIRHIHLRKFLSMEF